jgi:hypothetical protein
VWSLIQPLPHCSVLCNGHSQVVARARRQLDCESDWKSGSMLCCACRQVRRKMEDENRKARRVARREYNDAVSACRALSWQAAGTLLGVHVSVE